MEKHGVDMEFIPDARMLTETDELPVDKLDLLLEELNRSRDILESNEISAIIAYNTADKNIDPLLLSYFVTDESGKGYQVYVNDKVPAIIVYYDGEHVFDIPKGLPAEVVLYEWGYRFLFSEIFRKNDSIIGKLLCYENELELPPVKVKSGTKSFFSTIHGDEGVHRIEHTTIPVLKKYEYFQTLFEKYAAVAKKFNITIKFS